MFSDTHAMHSLHHRQRFCQVLRGSGFPFTLVDATTAMNCGTGGGRSEGGEDSGLERQSLSLDVVVSGQWSFQ